MELGDVLNLETLTEGAGYCGPGCLRGLAGEAGAGRRRCKVQKRPHARVHEVDLRPWKQRRAGWAGGGGSRVLLCALAMPGKWDLQARCPSQGEWTVGAGLLGGREV